MNTTSTPNGTTIDGVPIKQWLADNADTLWPNPDWDRVIAEMRAEWAECDCFDDIDFAMRMETRLVALSKLPAEELHPRDRVRVARWLPVLQAGLI